MRLVAVVVNGCAQVVTWYVKGKLHIMAAEGAQRLLQNPRVPVGHVDRGFGDVKVRTKYFAKVSRTLMFAEGVSPF